MDEQTSGRKGLLSAQQAADYLGVSRRTLSRYQQHGTIKHVHEEKGRLYFRPSDLNELRGRVGENSQTSHTALEALSTAQRAEDMCLEILRILGFDRALISDQCDDVRRDYHRALRILKEDLVVLEEEQLDWARRLNTVTEAYFRVMALHTADPMPWRAYVHLLLRFLKPYKAKPQDLLGIQLLQALVAVRQAAYLTVAGQQDKSLTADVVRSSFMGKVRDTLRQRSGKAPPLHPDNVILDKPFHPTRPTAAPAQGAPSSG